MKIIENRKEHREKSRKRKEKIERRGRGVKCKAHSVKEQEP